MKIEEFEKFSVYNFSIGYPPECRVEFNPKSRREAGDIVFHFPDREKVHLSWGELEKAKNRFETAEKHAEHSLQVVKNTRNVKKVETLWSDILSLNMHRAPYSHLRLDQIQSGIFPSKRTISCDAYSVHLHCENSSRYFVIYTMLSPNAPSDFGDLFTVMAKSFKCH